MARILICEDETLIALMLEAAVAEAGHESFGVASSVAQAEELLADGRPDAAILDLRLGNELSYSIAAALKRQAIPYVFLTGYDDQAVDKAFAPIIVLRKPVSAEDVGLVLKTLLPRA